MISMHDMPLPEPASFIMCWQDPASDSHGLSFWSAWNITSSACYAYKVCYVYHWINVWSVNDCPFSKLDSLYVFNTLRPEYFFKCMFLNGYYLILIQFLLKFALKCPNGNMSLLIQVVNEHKKVTSHFLNQWRPLLDYIGIYGTLKQMTPNFTTKLPSDTLVAIWCQKQELVCQRH